MNRKNLFAACVGDTSTSRNSANRRSAPNDSTLADPSAAFFRVKAATATYGISRSFVYRALAEGRVVAVKAGRSILIDGNSLRRYLASLPKAVFKAPQ